MEDMFTIDNVIFKIGEIINNGQETGLNIVYCDYYNEAYDCVCLCWGYDEKYIIAQCKEWLETKHRIK